MSGLTQLTNLNVSRNQIDDLSPLSGLIQLVRLNVAGNHFSDLSNLKCLLALDKLRDMDLRHNHVAIPTECQTDISALRAYFEDGSKGVASQRHAKLMFLGDPCVGKTTLLRHMEFGRVPEAIGIDERTEGIQLSRWQEVLPNVVVNAWDFGGQELLHNTHRLFLGERAVYVVVYCAPNLKKCGQDEHHPLSYWLDFIADNGTKSTVLLVENTVDGQLKSTEFPDDVMLEELVNLYAARQVKLVPSPFRFDCHNDSREVRNFADRIKNEISDIHVDFGYQDYPLNWFELQEQLQALKQEQNTLEMPDYLALAQKENISDPLAVLRVFNTEGVIGYYPDIFEDRIILNMAWALDAIYAILRLRDNPLARKKGKLTDADFEQVWTQYSPKEKELFKSYMLRSQLMVEPFKYRAKLDRDYRYLVPALFAKPAEHRRVNWEKKDRYVAIKFRFMFGAVMQRLQIQILKHCHYDEEEDLCQSHIGFTDQKQRSGFVEVVGKELRVYSESDELVQTILQEINQIYPLDRAVEIVECKANGECVEYDYRKNVRQDLRLDKVVEEQTNRPSEIKVFVTYCWSDENGNIDRDHQDMVGKLVYQLRTQWGMEATFDLYEMNHERNFVKMMYQRLQTHDKVIIVLSKGYAQRADEFKGGVGTEYERIINDIKEKPKKYILLSFGAHQDTAVPYGMKGDEIITLFSPMLDASRPNPEQEKLLSYLTDQPLYEMPPVSSTRPVIKPKSF